MPTTFNSDPLVPGESVKDDSSVKKMFFKNELITEESAKIIAENIRQNVALEILYFCNNGLKDAALHHIIQAIIDRSSLKIFINDNNITDQSAKFIAEVLSSAPNAISQLNLERNRLTAQGVKWIVQALSNISKSGLKALSFSGNQSIDDACIDDLIHLFNENLMLKSLYLEKCSLSDDGKQRLRQAITNKKAFSLQL
jgi:Ran GTPase-activating protein (RanGAP) involved in mRNA processing and transport